MANSRLCSIPDCRNPHEAKGYCSSHYMRMKAHGDPLSGSTLIGEPLRFVHEVALLHTGDDCLKWPFGKNQDGRGRVWVDGKNVVVSRYVCELVNGPPPSPEHEAAHSCGCGHSGCIAPGHLNWKTKADNEADKLIHDTHSRGERSVNAKLTEASVREIISLRGVETQLKLAERFSVSSSAISHIHNGRSWAWMSEETKDGAA